MAEENDARPAEDLEHLLLTSDRVLPATPEVAFEVFTDPERLAFTFRWVPADADDVQTLAALSFRSLGESTEVHLTQSRFKTKARRDLHRDGWRESFDRLERLLSDA